MKSRLIVRSAWLPALLVAAGAAYGLTPKEQLGKEIFFDENLSTNFNQSCATCHGPAAGWTGPDSIINAFGAVYEGSIPGAFGDRKPPSSAYATQSPILHVVVKNKNKLTPGLFVGGNFWDGRATGEILGSPAAEQAKGPFLNPVEQALPSAAELVSRVCTSSYGDLFREVWGEGACDPVNVALDYDRIGYSVAAFEASPESNAFSSKYDLYLAGKAKLTEQEKEGLKLFKGKGQCVGCHVFGPGQGRKDGGLFTDFTYDNLGLPRNPDNPVYSYMPGFVDPGLGGFLATRADYAGFAADSMGKQKVPTLRNVDKRPSPDMLKAYGHNGYFKSLWQIVHFYNTRDVKPACPGDYRAAEAIAAGCWPAAEVTENVNTTELGNLGLTLTEEYAIVAFMKTLSDGYVAP
jgi:cytochrome c peroxidase